MLPNTGNCFIDYFSLQNQTPRFHFPYGKTISPKIILCLELTFCWTKCNLRYNFAINGTQCIKHIYKYEKKIYSTKNIAKNLRTFSRPTALARSLKGSINVNPTNMAFSLKEWMNVNLSCIEKHLYKNTFLSLWLLSLFLFMLCFYASSSSDWRCRLRMWKAKHMIKLLLSIFIFGNKNTSSKHS